MNRIRFTLSLFLLLSPGFSREVRATQSENHGIHAVPAPGPVAIDGSLNEWDLSGKIVVCYDLETLRDVYSAEIAMMYSAEDLYVAIHWKSPKPMSNSHDPQYQANRGWAGDCVQLRFKTDRISHVTAWEFAARQEPTINIDYGKSLTESFGGGGKQLFRTEGWKLSDGAEMAFKADPDGHGYIQEMKLPWALITNGRRFAAGDRFSCGIELMWGATDWPVHRYADNLAEGTTSREFFWTAKDAWGPVFLEAKGALNLPEPAFLKALHAGTPQGPAEIAFDLPKDSRVSLAIEDEAGKRIRHLLAAQPRKQGRNVEHWDGLDDQGKPVAAGTFNFKALYHDGIHANYVMSFANPGHPSWSTSDNKGAFYGDHTAPQAVACADKFVALACPMGEAGKHLIGCDLNGQRQWGLANRTAFDGGHISLATDGKILWVANEGRDSIIYRVDAATGIYAPWDLTEKDKDGREYKVLDLKVSDIPKEKRGGQTNLSAIACRKGLVAAALTVENQIKILDGQNGTVRETLSLPAPRALVFLADDQLLVVSESKLLRLALGAGGGSKPELFARTLFPDAYGLTADEQGSVYLSVRGADMNVKVFSKDGTLLREIGRKGGRPNHGAFSDDAMRLPAQLAIDSQARLWVAEETQNPKRTSVWSAADGKFLMDLVGTTSYAGAGAINPNDPTMAVSDNTIYKIDLESGAWRPVYSTARSEHPDEIFAPHFDSRVRFMEHGGATYLFSTSRTQAVQCMICKDGAWRPAACVGIARKSNDPEVPINFQHALMKGHENQLFLWADKNGDGLVQADELTFSSGDIDGTPTRFAGLYWGVVPDPKGTVSYIANGGRELVKLSIHGFTACGAPEWNITQPSILKLSGGFALSMGGEGMIAGASGGRVFINQDPLVCIEPDGTVTGGYPSKHVSVHGSHTAKSACAGYLIGPSSILGIADLGGDAGQVFSMNGNLGENYLMTNDCMWVQALFKDCRGGFEIPDRAVRGMSMDAITAGGESFGGNFVRAKNGKIYLLIGGTDAQVLEITGLESIRRFQGKFNYTPEQFAAAQELIAQRAVANAKFQVAKIKKLATAVSIDGKAADWPELTDDAAPLIEIQESAQHRFGRVAARYDEQFLYLAYRVFAHDNKPRNAGQDSHLLFKTGDCVDLMLQTPTTGIRLLMTAAVGKPTCVLYEKTVAGTAEKDRAPFSSPSRTIYFDRVSEPADVQTASGPISGGYFLEAKIPWSRLGVTPTPGLKLKGDFGILSADSGGTTCVARQYWSNQATGLVNDVPGEAELQPNLWGSIEIE